MDIGIVGLGRMGSGVAHRLLQAGHRVVAFNRSPEKAAALAAEGATAAASLADLVAALPAPRVVWLYLPSGEVTQQHISELAGLLAEGDAVLDGGNSHFSKSLQAADLLAERGISFMDVGTSGGVAGRERGFCLMIGGQAELFERLTPLWEAAACPGGFRRVGPQGAGHYVKMVHNAIEYGMMQAYGEGVEVLAASRFGADLDLSAVTDLWQHGSIITSYLGSLLAEAMAEDASLSGLGTRIDDNGEGRWTLQEALELGVPTPVTSAALCVRYQSRDQGSLSNKVVAVLRNKFGGHALSKPNQS